MLASFLAILTGALLLLSIALVVVTRRRKRQQTTRPALLGREPPASARLVAPAAPGGPADAAAANTMVGDGGDGGDGGSTSEGPPRGPEAAFGAAVDGLTADEDVLPATVREGQSEPPMEVAPPTVAIEAPTTDAASSTLVLREDRPLVWTPSRRRGQTRHPIVLAHGFGGFDAIQFRGRRLVYFRGIAEHLRSSGAEVYVLRVSPVASISVRAHQLAEQLRRLPAERVNIVAHSMGGLDARYAIKGLGISDKIASLTTIGTPHRGTPLADLGMSLLARGSAFGRLGLPLDACHDLTAARMEAFNRAVADVPGVDYGCFVAAARRGVMQVNALLVPGYLFLHRRAGENDGVVPAASQRWGQVLGEIDVDHWGAVGWSTAFDAARFYERVVIDLRARGL